MGVLFTWTIDVYSNRDALCTWTMCV